MKRNIKPVDYVTKDYEGFRQMMIDLIPSLTPEWTDTSQSDFGIVLIELMSYGLDVLSFYQDKAFNENFLETARTRKAVIELCKWLGYELAPQKPARHKIVFEKSSEYLDEEIIIYRGTKVSTDPQLGDPVVFEVDDDIVIPAGIIKAEGTITHGITIPEDIIGIGDGTPNQKFTLFYPDVILDTLTIVTRESGVEKGWIEVQDFLASTADDRHYTASTDEFNKMSLEFGSGVTGMRIPNGIPAVANYRVGGGRVGNVGLNTVNSLVEDTIAGIVKIYNPEQAIELGVDIEDIEHAKLVAPKAYRAVDKAVTAQDFEDLILKEGEVEKVKCLETFNANGDLDVYVVPRDFGLTTQALRDRIIESLEDVKLVHTNPIIKDADYVGFDIKLDIVTQENYKEDVVRNDVINTLYDIFDPKYMEFGEDVLVGSIFKEVLSIDGVKNLSIMSPLADVELTESQFPKVGDISVVIHVKGIIIDRMGAEIAIGETLGLVAKAQPTNADNQNIIWSSDNEAVATVDESGVVTGVSAGQATITATTEEYGFEAKCTLSVA